MKLTFKLFASLGEYLPADSKNHAATIEVEDDASVNDVVAQFNIPEDQVHLVLLNGVYLHPQQRLESQFKEGDTLAIWPPVAGG